MEDRINEDLPGSEARVVDDLPQPPRRIPCVEEVDVPFGTWHLRRCGKGLGPICNCFVERSVYGQDECRNHIKETGLELIDGRVVGIAIHVVGLSLPHRQLLYFYPNNRCHLTCGQRTIAQLPKPPARLKVQRGTCLMVLEIDFLLGHGLEIEGLMYTLVVPL